MVRMSSLMEFAEFIFNTSVWVEGCSNIFVEILGSGLGVILNFLDISFNICSNLLFDIFKLLLLGKLVVKDNFSNYFNWISILSYISNLVSGSVCNSGVRHRVTVISVSFKLNKERSIAFNAPFFGEFHCFSNIENTLPINF